MNLSHSIHLFVSQWEMLMWRTALLPSAAGSRGRLKFQRKSYSHFVRRDAPQHQLSQTEPKAIHPSSFHSFITKVFYCPLSMGPPLPSPVSRLQPLPGPVDVPGPQLLTLAQWGRRHGTVLLQPCLSQWSDCCVNDINSLVCFVQWSYLDT